VGEKLAKGQKLTDIIAEMNMVAEGVKSSKAILAIGQAHGVDLPIIEGVVKVLHEGASPEDMGQALMSREPKREFHGLQATPRRGQ
jgi:glycerol-3-phosphate dehydrogenase (NAD(P)+)